MVCKLTVLTILIRSVAELATAVSPSNVFLKLGFGNDSDSTDNDPLSPSNIQSDDSPVATPISIVNAQLSLESQVSTVSNSSDDKLVTVLHIM